MADSRPFEEVVALLKKILRKHGYSEAVSSILAANCAAAQRDGSTSHGVFRIPNYVSTIQSGYVSGTVEPRVEDVAPGFIRADSGNGFAQVALARARSLLEQKAKANGIAILAIRNSHHLGALYLDIEDFAEKGFIALAFVNSMAVVAPPEAHSPVYGTNPMAFAAPREGAAPLVFDQASSSMAHGDLQVARREGRRLPSGCAIDSKGIETTDPAQALEGGALLTFGGHKGASIALMVELLCAALVGADFSYEVDWSTTPGAKSARTGQTIILIDPNTGGAGLAPFPMRVNDLVSALRAAGQRRIPGDRRLARRSPQGDGTVSISREEWESLVDMT